jgi:uncharacterized damage-inducible protein DinB
MTQTAAVPDTVALLFPELDQELVTTRRMLERFPDTHAGWQPHKKSRPLDALATHVASLPMHGARLIETDEVDLATRQPAPVRSAAADLLALFDQSVEGLRAALPKATGELLDRPWTMRAGPRVLVSGPRRVLFRNMLINHLVHHRAQLGMYYRLLDVPVPGTYGPSADEPL